ncbi:MAG: thioredoxin domain-containing protein [Polyangiaceae bacterium]
MVAEAITQPNATDSKHGDRWIALSLLVALGAAFALVSGFRRPALPAAHASSPAQTSDVVDDDACTKLRSRLCRQFGDSSSACKLAQNETASFTNAHCTGMLTRFDKVASELGEMDLGVKKLTAKEQALVHGLAPTLGGADAKLTLVEFCDFQTPDCGRASPMAHTLQNMYGDRVRFVFRQYPSPKVPHAALVAEAALAANDQGKFWEYHDVLYSNPQDHGRAALERYAQELQLDMARFRRALDEHVFANDVAADVALGHQVQALDRPSLYANGRRVAMPYGVTELSKLVDAELAKLPAR